MSEKIELKTDDVFGREWFDAECEKMQQSCPDIGQAWGKGVFRPFECRVIFEVRWDRLIKRFDRYPGAAVAALPDPNSDRFTGFPKRWKTDKMGGRKTYSDIVYDLEHDLRIPGKRTEKVLGLFDVLSKQYNINDDDNSKGLRGDIRRDLRKVILSVDRSIKNYVPPDDWERWRPLSHDLALSFSLVTRCGYYGISDPVIDDIRSCIESGAVPCGIQEVDGERTIVCFWPHTAPPPIDFDA